jgi:hypothetical protein
MKLLEDIWDSTWDWFFSLDIGWQVFFATVIVGLIGYLLKRFVFDRPTRAAPEPSDHRSAMSDAEDESNLSATERYERQQQRTKDEISRINESQPFKVRPDWQPNTNRFRVNISYEPPLGLSRKYDARAVTVKLDTERHPYSPRPHTYLSTASVGHGGGTQFFMEDAIGGHRIPEMPLLIEYKLENDPSGAGVCVSTDRTFLRPVASHFRRI